MAGAYGAPGGTDDLNTLGELAEWLQPYARWLVSLAPYAGARSVRITSVYRSPARQRELWENRHKNPYPVAPPGRSKHEHRIAWDMVTDPYDALYVLGAWWKQIGGRWFEADPIHFEV